MAERMEQLADLLRDRADEILHRWVNQARVLPAVKDQPLDVLRNAIPELLEHVAVALEEGQPPGELTEISREHAQVRMEVGIDARQLIAEYQLLRRAVLEVIGDALEDAESLPARHQLVGIALLNELLDAAVIDSVDAYMEERDRAREVFIAVLGHDLRNPLHLIRLATATLLRRGDQLDHDQLRRVSGAAKALDRIDGLVSDLLDFARGRLGGGIPINPSSNDLHEIVSDVAEELSMTHPNRDVQIAQHEEDCCIGEWDRPRISQAVSNLMMNALTHGEDPITVSVREQNDELVIEVTSRGAIPERLRKSLFDPFVSSVKGEGGLGLGLYVVDQIARAHGGRAEIEGGREDRTTARMILPRYSPKEA